MQIMTKRISVIALAACLLAALTFGGYSVAQAAWWTPNNNSLTVKASEKENEQKELADVGAYVNLFKVATATPEDDYEAFTYTYVKPFGTGAEPDEPLTPPMVGDPEAIKTWQMIAEDAAKEVSENPPGAAGRGELTNEPDYKAKIFGLEDGIYLVMVYAEQGYYEVNDDGSTTIKGARTEYTFKPQLVALPTKDDINGQIASSNPVPWKKELDIVLKSGQAPSYGSLVINKTVNNFQGTKATFTYHIESTEDSPYKCDEWAAITATSEGSFSTSLRHIKAGTKVTVSEIYDGSRFTNSGPRTSEAITIEADVDRQPFNTDEWPTFTNTGNDRIVDGSGIQNQFTLQNNGDWTLVATPDSSQMA